MTNLANLINMICTNRERFNEKMCLEIFTVVDAYDHDYLLSKILKYTDRIF